MFVRHDRNAPDRSAREHVRDEHLMWASARLSILGVVVSVAFLPLLRDA